MNASDPFTSAQVQQIAVVTGSTSDIGEALCRLLLARGVHLLALDRNAARAQACHRRLHDAFPQARIDAYQADLADQASVQAVFLAFAAMEAAFQIWGTQLHVVDLPPTRTAMAHGDGMPAWLKPFGFLFASPQTSARRLLDAALQPPPGSAFLVGAPEAAHTAALLDTIHQAGLQTV